MAKKRLAKKARAASSSKTLANKSKLPAVENRHTRERGHSITYELRPVICGKPKCLRHHGPYWYAYWTQGGRVHTVYIGRKFERVEVKKPQAFGAAA